MNFKKIILILILIVISFEIYSTCTNKGNTVIYIQNESSFLVDEYDVSIFVDDQQIIDTFIFGDSPVALQVFNGNILGFCNVKFKSEKLLIQKESHYLFFPMSWFRIDVYKNDVTINRTFWGYVLQ